MSVSAYEAWHAEVARLVSERHPSAVVNHETQLGGGINAVTVECGDDTVIVISDDALGIYTRAQWFGAEDEADGDFPFSDDMGSPEDAVSKADPYISAAGC
jgi:hypothetical protein